MVKKGHKKTIQREEAPESNHCRLSNNKLRTLLIAVSLSTPLSILPITNYINLEVVLRLLLNTSSKCYAALVCPFDIKEQHPNYVMGGTMLLVT